MERPTGYGAKPIKRYLTSSFRAPWKPHGHLIEKCGRSSQQNTFLVPDECQVDLSHVQELLFNKVSDTKHRILRRPIEIEEQKKIGERVNVCRMRLASLSSDNREREGSTCRSYQLKHVGRAHSEAT